MVDLMAQYEKIKPAIDEALHSVIDKTQFINGPEVAAFQSELASYLDVKHRLAAAKVNASRASASGTPLISYKTLPGAISAT